ncbi:hypothetical protein Btru_015641 [Bulinus truncatus]|nr:hypothetical protein Btru_015641 [Bulinus truncatus]
MCYAYDMCRKIVTEKCWRYGGDVDRKCSISTTLKGKPFLVSSVDRTSPRSDVSFNISHHGDYVVFVAERDRLVGVDVMKIEWERTKPVSNFFNTMEDQLTSQEWKQVKSFKSEMEQLKTFLRFWCLKESLVKTSGTGIGFEVSRLNFKLKTPEMTGNQVIRNTEVEIDNDPAPEWHFEETLLDDHCVVVAVQDAAYENTDEVPLFRVLDIQDVLSGCEPLTGSSPDQQYWELFSSREEGPDTSSSKILSFHNLLFFTRSLLYYVSWSFL